MKNNEGKSKCSSRFCLTVLRTMEQNFHHFTTSLFRNVILSEAEGLRVTSERVNFVRFDLDGTNSLLTGSGKRRLDLG